MRVISFINEKGGSCKTTLSVNFAFYLASKGLKTTIIDMDPQGAAGKTLGVEIGNIEKTILDILIGSEGTDINNTTIKVGDNLYLIPSNKLLASFPIECEGIRESERLLKKVVSNIDTNIVIIDSPPSMNLLTINVIVASDDIIIPVPLTYLSLEGCADLLETLEAIKRYHDVEPRILGIIPVFWRRTKLANEILNKLQDFFGNNVKITEPLGFDVKIDEAQSHGKPIFEYALNSKGASSIKRIADSLLLSETS